VTQAAAHAVGRCPLASNPPYEATVLALFREQLREAVGQLPPLEQQLIQVHYYQEESLSQMARDIGLSRQTLSKYHQQALARLEETLRRRGLTEEAWPDRWEVNFY
jgi:RNA polymerase sigma factor (sigma-70 family)